MPREEQQRHGGEGLSFRATIAKALAVPGLLWTVPAHPQDLTAVTLKFLKLHHVPCDVVLEVTATPSLGETALCQDGREWATFWIENDVAFVHPLTRELYRWNFDLNALYPQLYNVLVVRSAKAFREEALPETARSAKASGPVP